MRLQTAVLHQHPAYRNSTSIGYTTCLTLEAMPLVTRMVGDSHARSRTSPFSCQFSMRFFSSSAITRCTDTTPAAKVVTGMAAYMSPAMLPRNQHAGKQPEYASAPWSSTGLGTAPSCFTGMIFAAQLYVADWDRHGNCVSASGLGDMLGAHRGRGCPPRALALQLNSLHSIASR